MYVPASRLRGLVEKWRAAIPVIAIYPIGERVMLESCIADLEGLLKEDV